MMVLSAGHTRYLRNPDAVVREEDTAGALVFNPDTDQIRLLNQTGFFVWQMCNGRHDLQGIVSAVMEAFAGVPQDQVYAQVEAFVHQMVSSGFIGTVVEKT